MIKIINREENQGRIILMSQMQPLEIAELLEGEHAGSLVLRTACCLTCEVMLLGDHSGPGRCWIWNEEDGLCFKDLHVRLLHPSEKVTIVIYNTE